MKSNGLQLMLSYVQFPDTELNRQALRCIKNIAVLGNKKFRPRAQFLDDAKLALVESETILNILEIYLVKKDLVKKLLAEIMGLVACHRKLNFPAIF